MLQAIAREVVADASSLGEGSATFHGYRIEARRIAEECGAGISFGFYRTRAEFFGQARIVSDDIAVDGDGLAACRDIVVHVRSGGSTGVCMAS